MFELRAFASILIAAAALALPPLSSAQETPIEQVFYVADEKTYPLELELDALGLVLRSDSEREAEQVAARLAATLDGRVEGVFRGGLVVVRFKGRRERAELDKLARELERSRQNLIAKAGLVLRRFRGDDPVLATDELIVRLRDEGSLDQIKELNAELGAEVAMPNPFRKEELLIRVGADAGQDVLEVAERYRQLSGVADAYPNFINVFYDTETLLNDTFFGNQWHLRNTGQSGGTVDADADLHWAWDITQGAAGTVIAVLENGGFDMTHPDLTPNLWTNPGEVPGNNVDDDGNSLVDDVNGWDFGGCTAAVGLGCGDNNPASANATENHGTSVAGVAAARGGNSLGVSGSCPNCGLLLMRTGYTASDFAKSLAFGYAQALGFRIISNSWGGGGAMPNTVAAINNVTAAGVVVLFASGNTTANVCAGLTADPRVSLAGVIAVSSTSNQDRKVVWSAIGNCIDVLAPSHRGYTAADPYTGTLNVTTTDRQGANGYNNASPVNNCPQAEPAPPPANDRDYTNCFGGTSSATPLTAGIVGLALTVNNTLTRAQVQNLLQDTADRAEDSAGAYSDINGFSSPATGTATHANGRVNAFEAVRVVAPVAQGGRAGVDVFLRDNRLDWGNTEQPSNHTFEATPGFIGHWRSVDIKVDAGPVFQPAPTAATFDAFVDETPTAISGETNRVYVRVRNRGPATVGTVRVKLHWAQFGAGLPPLPGNFWAAFPGDPGGGSWTPMNCAVGGTSVCTLNNLGYSGASVAGTAGDVAQIARFDFPAPPVNASLPNHFCLLGIVDSDLDPISAQSQASFVVDDITPNDNNVTHRNYHNLPTGAGDSFLESFFVRNPYERPLETYLSVQVSPGWRAVLDGVRERETFTLKPLEERLVRIHLFGGEPDHEAEVTVRQEMVEPARVLGGLTYRYRPRFDRPRPEPVTPAGSESAYLIGAWLLAQDERSLVRVINPTGHTLYALAAFFDDDEKPLRCSRAKLSGNDLWELDVAKMRLPDGTGVVKILALDPASETPRSGLVGSVLQTDRRGTLSETSLHPISEQGLSTDLDRILSACREK